MAQLERLFIISRPVYWIPIMAMYWWGVISASGGFNFYSWAGLAFYTLPMGLVAYGINDISDRQIDIHNPRKGGVDGALITDGEVNLIRRSVVLATVGFFGLLLVSHHWLSALMMGSAVLLSYAYSYEPLRLKSRPIIDSLTNGLGLSLIFASGYFINSHSLSASWPFNAQLLVAFLTGFAFHALGTILDYDADIKSGERTIAIELGKRPTAVLTCAVLALNFFLVNSLVLQVFCGTCAVLNLFICIWPEPHFIARMKLVFFGFLLVPLPAIFILTHLGSS